MKKIALITGASGGIGQAICEALAKDGCNLALHYSSSGKIAEELCERLSREYNIEAISFKADFSDENAVKALAEKVLSRFGRADILVNNAGIAYQTLFQLADERKIKEVLDINLLSALSLTKEILPSMINSKWGRIINISSMWGISGASCEVHYSAAKSGLIGFTKALAKEVGPSGITVNCVAPGFIDTKMNGNLDGEAVQEIIDCTPVGRAGTGEDVAELVRFLAGEKAEFITGQVISVDGGYGV
ncbi:MAG: 3-oxoacyl-ACP reductase FabG [Clostridia bacterium]|nr:3-oxoacyl-ACP reductase FabG [Clostridia bacterium]MBQ7117032.1 3-oxoacyl-ACP reductase FabG [Clostridia bacterium]